MRFVSRKSPFPYVGVIFGKGVTREVGVYYAPKRKIFSRESWGVRHWGRWNDGRRAFSIDLGKIHVEK